MGLNFLWNFAQGVLIWLTGVFGKKVVKIVCAVLLVISIVFLVLYLKTENGRNWLNLLMGQFPFAKYVYEKYSTITGYSIKLPSIAGSSVSLDLIRLLAGALIRSLICTILYRLFGAIIPDRYPKNQILAGSKPVGGVD